MSGKNYQWHKRWRWESDTRMTHESGLAFDVVPGDGFTDLLADDKSLQAFQQHECDRGVTLPDIEKRLMRLQREAEKFFRHAR